MQLERDFFNRDTETVAKELLGKFIIRNTDCKVLRAKIVETEAYIGEFDKACHTYNNKHTPRTEIMFGEAGHLYIYLIYGMYNLVNIVTSKNGIGEAVLIRAIEPVNGIDEMAIFRFGKLYGDLSNYQKKNLCNGPGKLSIALNLDKSNNEEDICNSSRVYIEDNKEKIKIVKSTRIGVDYAEEARDFLLRFYIEGNNYVSVK